mmetsp:Transcript_56588/g.177733  ORF Transcript_56588/g.177733 Transcript_56588/m.177733 type:complete len:217 (+) Transcript_56588:828-1478(+)
MLTDGLPAPMLLRLLLREGTGGQPGRDHKDVVVAPSQHLAADAELRGRVVGLQGRAAVPGAALRQLLQQLGGLSVQHAPPQLALGAVAREGPGGLEHLVRHRPVTGKRVTGALADRERKPVVDGQAPVRLHVLERAEVYDEGPAAILPVAVGPKLRDLLPHALGLQHDLAAGCPDHPGTLLGRESPGPRGQWKFWAHGLPGWRHAARRERLIKNVP